MVLNSPSTTALPSNGGAGRWIMALLVKTSFGDCRVANGAHSTINTGEQAGSTASEQVRGAYADGVGRVQTLAVVVTAGGEVVARNCGAKERRQERDREGRHRRSGSSHGEN